MKKTKLEIVVETVCSIAIVAGVLFMLEMLLGIFS